MNLQPPVDGALAWLYGQDPDGAARAELLASGVAKHTIEALYPDDFALVVPALCKHVRAVGVAGMRNREEEFDHHIANLRRSRESLSAELKAKCATDFSEERRMALEVLRSEFALQFEKAEIGRQENGIFAASAIWYCWWFLHNGEHLPEGALDAVNATTLWFARNVLQLPEV